MTFINKTCKILLIFLLISFSALALNKGDPNNDGEVNIFDVRICWQYSLGLISLTQEQQEACDVTSPCGTVDRNDAELIAQVAIGVKSESAFNCVNEQPTSTISSPAGGASFTQGDTITFTGSGTDPEDGALTGASLVWTSSIDGQIGISESFTRSDLSVGTHTITLAATDTHGATGTDSVTITVTAPPPSFHFWVGELQTHTVYKIDPNGNIIKSFTIPNLQPMGLAWDGSYLWVSSQGLKIYKIDPADGTILTSFPCATWAAGLTWDGSNLWVGYGYGVTWIEKLDTTGHSLERYRAPGPAYSVADGMAWDGSYLWYSENTEKKIYQLDPINGNVLESFNSPVGWPNGLTWCANHLWVLNTGRDRIYEIDTSNQSVIRSLPAPPINSLGLACEE